MENQNKNREAVSKKREILKMSNKESNQMTRECLQTALIFLMSQMPFEKISISELVRRSGVSRTAFYRNYSSKEEILNELCTAFLDGLDHSFSDSGFPDNPYAWYYNFFKSIKENAALFRLLLQAHMLNTPLFTSYSISQKLDHSKDAADHYEFLAWEGAITTIVIHWFQDGMQESVEYMAGFCAGNLHLKIARRTNPPQTP